MEQADGTFDKLKKIVAEQLAVNEEDVKPESFIREDLGADSLDSVELVMAIEEAFDVEIPDELAEKIDTIQHIMDHLTALGK